MTEEIKEILDYLKDKDVYIEKFGYQFKRIGIDHCFQLLDYITNLQQENEKLKEEIDILKSNFEVEIDDCENYKKWYRDYKSRFEKAIEYIEERKNLNWYADGVFVDELSNILNGSDEK